MQARPWPFSPSLTGGLDLPTGCVFTSCTSSWNPALPAALVSSYNPKRQEHCRGAGGTQGQTSKQNAFGMPEPQPVCLSEEGREGLPTLTQCPSLKLVQYKTSQFIVFLDINIDSG